MVVSAKMAPLDPRGPAISNAAGPVEGSSAGARPGASTTAGAGRRPPQRPSRAALIVRATRPQYLPTSLVPALVGALAAIGTRDVEWALLPVALLALLCVHAGTDVANDTEDAARGVDTPDKVDNSRVFTTGLMSIAEGRRVAAVFFAVAFALGLAIVAVQGPALLVIGIIGIVGAWGYSAGPRPLKFLGLGEVSIVPLMGPLLTQGAYTAVTGDPFHAPAFWIGFAPGLLIAAVLAGNNLSDIPGDRAAGVRSLAVRLGFDRARMLYLVLLVLSYGTPVLAWAADLFEWPVLLPLITLPLAAGRFAQVRSAHEEGDESLATLPLRTAQLHLLFTVLLVAGVVLSRL